MALTSHCSPSPKQSFIALVAKHRAAKDPVLQTACRSISLNKLSHRKLASPAPALSPPSTPWPILALGFRPFYLLACIYAVLNVPLWLAQYRGWLVIDGYFDGLTWHAHELIFGFAVAVISGFLLTAVRNWTQQPTPSGPLLGGLALLWVAGRILCATGPAIPAAVVDLLFLPCLGIALGIPLMKTRNSNMFVLVVLGVLALVNLAMHLNQLGVVSVVVYPNTIDVAFDVIAILMAVIAGRVTPLFINNFVKAANAARRSEVEFIAVGLLVGVLLLDVVNPTPRLPSFALVCLYAIAAATHFFRLSLWRPRATFSEPLLWILPLSYAWIPIWLLLRAAAELSLVSGIVHHHALAIGAMSSLMLGMMTRSALGHTGRRLHAGSIETAAFVLIQLAVFLRIMPSVVLQAFYQGGLILSAVCWTGAFTIILFKYGPMLVRPRIDGQPG